MSPAIPKGFIYNHNITTTATHQRPQLLRSNRSESSVMSLRFFDTIEHVVHSIAHPFHRHDKDLEHERRVYHRQSQGQVHDKDLDFERKTYHKARVGTHSLDRLRDAEKKGVNFMAVRERCAGTLVPDPRKENEVERERMARRKM
ncbi:hypothetical protein E2P81_ATG03274 [Venturia nashicola]|nr:hypothetical protein E2P81_ATG03274 [Venturia nashicola]